MTALCPPSDYAAITQPTTSGWPLGIDDAHLLPWGPLTATDVPRRQLLLFAQRQLAHLMNLPSGWDDADGAPVSARSAKMALVLLDAIIFTDNLATPQISPHGDGGVDIEWLVAGNHLSMSVANDDSIILWGIDANGLEAFSYDSAEEGLNEKDLVAVVNSARGFLLTMSTDIRNRIAVW
jgi:hypothetical protein